MIETFSSGFWLDQERSDHHHHRQPFEPEETFPSNLGPIGPPSKAQKPPVGGLGKSGGSSGPVGGRGDVGGRPEGGRFSPIGSRGGVRTSPGGGAANMSPQQRSSDPSPVAKSPLLGPAPPGGLLPTPEKGECESGGHNQDLLLSLLLWSMAE